MTQDTIKDRLRAARALIDQPEKWTQHASQRDVNGKPLRFELAGAVTRCAYGALMKACRNAEEGEVVEHLVQSISRHLPTGYYGGLAPWNDKEGRTHAEVMLAFDRAIMDKDETDAPRL